MNRSIYMLWLGDEQMNDERKLALMKLPGATLITKHNVNDYILKEYPLHPAYPHLSTIHKSDYLRCYLMHHYGGGYSDVKHRPINWAAAFDNMAAHTDLMMMGLETTWGHTITGMEEWSNEIQEAIINHIPRLFCMGWFICKAYSPITTEWYDELNKRLDNFLPELIKCPATRTRETFHKSDGCAFEKPIWEGRTAFRSMYPLSWTIILSQILYPLQLKYLTVIQNTL